MGTEPRTPHTHTRARCICASLEWWQLSGYDNCPSAKSDLVRSAAVVMCGCGKTGGDERGINENENEIAATHAHADAQTMRPHHGDSKKRKHKRGEEPMKQTNQNELK